jgi:hypothetical protein
MTDKCCDKDYNGDGDCPVHPARPTEVRIRRAFGDYRCIAPHAKSQGARLFINGALIIERLDKDALGNTRWVYVGSVDKPDVAAGKHSLMSAVYYLLAGSAE